MIEFCISTRVFVPAPVSEIPARIRGGCWDGLWWHYRQAIPEDIQGFPGLNVVGYECGPSVGDSLPAIQEALRKAGRIGASTLRMGLGHYDGQEADAAYLEWIGRQVGRVHELAAPEGIHLLLPVGGATLVQSADQAAGLAARIPEPVQWSWVLMQPVPGLENFGRACVSECHLRVNQTGELEAAVMRAWQEVLRPHLEKGTLQRMVVSGPPGLPEAGLATARRMIERLVSKG